MTPDAIVTHSTATRHRLVDRCDPFQLLSRGIEALITAAMGRPFDRRVMEDVPLPQEVFDTSENAQGPAQLHDDLWFDFLADTGDGWFSTYANASPVAQSRLGVNGKKLPRGRILIMDDEVYPVASQQNCRERVVAPFEAALPHTERSQAVLDLRECLSSDTARR